MDEGRRAFLGGMLGAFVIDRGWRTAPPSGYLSELGRMMRAAPVPGAVIGCVRGHALAWIAPLGVRVAGETDAVTSSTLFQAASLTKQVTARAAFALRAAGKLDFDRPLCGYVDDLKNADARTVTARHVLSHSSGFPNWRSPDASKSLPDLEPAFKPGSKYQYSGEGYFYLQRVLEQVAGAGFGQVVRDLVFEPLGMKSSTVVWDPDTVNRTAVPHSRRGEARQGWDKAARGLRGYAAQNGKTIDQLRYEDYAAATKASGDPALPNWMIPNGAASLVTSAEDYARFVAAAIRNPEISQQQVSINEFLGWGLGWAVERADGHTYVWQWGDNPGFKNFVLAEPSTGDALFVFTNGDSGARLYDRVITHATGHDHPALFWL